MKRFLVFFGSQYYPSGGWYDFRGSFDTLEDAKVFNASKEYDWCQIVDSQTGQIVVAV